MGLTRWERLVYGRSLGRPSFSGAKRPLPELSDVKERTVVSGPIAGTTCVTVGSGNCPVNLHC